MREKLHFMSGNSMLRWLLLTLLLANIAAENFAGPKTAYRIEEVISKAQHSHYSAKLCRFTYPQDVNKKFFDFFNDKTIQSIRYHFLSLKHHVSTALAIFIAPETMPIVMQQTGQFIKNKSLSSTDHSIFLF